MAAPRKPSPAKAMTGGVIAVITLIAALIAFYGWLVMLGFGIVHSIVPSVPAIGFWPSTGLGLIFVLLTGGVRRSSS